MQQFHLELDVVAEIAARYRDRRRAFLGAIRHVNGVAARGSEGGMYVMLDVSAVEPDCEAFAWGLLDAEKVAVLPGTSFGAAGGLVRVSMCQEEPVLREAAARIGRFISAHAARKAAE